MDTIRDFLDMGGYGSFVWPSYVVTAVVLIIMLVASQRLLRSNETTIRTLEKSTKEENVEKKT